MRIGILEDDVTLLKQIENILIEDGYCCRSFFTGQELMRFLVRDSFDVLIIDWNVPEISGIDLVKWLRHRDTTHVPVIMLTSRIDEDDIVRALNAGVDEYIAKPVSPAVLLARVRALLRLAYPKSGLSNLEQYGQFAFNTRTETLSIHGDPVQLTALEFSLALLLFRNLNRTLSRSYVFETVWGGNKTLQTRTVDTHISNIRRKIGLRPGRSHQ
ncbi:response regulator transcription factor [Novosphingobium album (ex Liu et al. 2023)]|uniref:Response regulator transcription factor n=1 Tax=Novosphingobium album (ex Liu et al. 2023) TaxID=3031130 RepID=A0ABT5WJJ1_9SPHN|nr:response regulator transcription factor [Novosphingobium album (ex Liu et al. 2023)]MDE8650212.1 response regulator transcription factor [Novosphingobium album (ex Liu et al. 2023)]